MRDKITKIKFFSIADHENEQEYLSQMHRSGWKIVRVDLPCFYHFVACKPENMVYQLDYYQESDLRREEYLKMFQDCGWEYLFDFMDYHYFRKPVAEMDGHEEIFCDDESRLDMMRRVFRGKVKILLVVFFAILLPQLIMNIINSVTRNSYGTGFLIFWIIMFILYMILFIRFARKYYALKKKVVR